MRAILVAVLLAGAAGWRTSGVLPSNGDFMLYAGKFCYDYNPYGNKEAGLMKISIEGSAPQGELWLYVFDDQEEKWPAAHARWATLTCETLNNYSSYAQLITPLNGGIQRTVSVLEGLRPRFWYFVFAGCGAAIVRPVTYQIHAENILQGWEREFSMDEQGSLVLQLLASLAFLGVILLVRYGVRSSSASEAMRSRPLLRLLQMSALCSCGGAAALLAHYASYAANGEGLPFLEVVGTVSVCLAKALLSLLQLLAAKGYSPLQRPLVLGALCAIILVTVASEIHGEFFRDWSTILYLYESWPGGIILALNLLLFAESWRSMRETYRNEASDELRSYYVWIAAASILYFVTLPVVCLLATLLNPWVRAKYVSRVEVISRLVATLILARCLWPSRMDAMVTARMEEAVRHLEPAEQQDLDEDVGRDAAE